MRWQDFIEQRPEIMLGKPVIRGTRITVELLLERLALGWNQEQLLEAYPHLRSEHVRAALLYASQSLASDETVFLTESGFS